jgi:membrane protease YdiL (CAAX protease family)
VEFTQWLAGDLVLTAIVLLWAKQSKLDLGLRAPVFKGAWPWISLYIAWYAADWAIFALYPAEEGPEWLNQLQRLPLLEELVLLVVTGPVFEELLFRGAMFSALLRRWGIWVAAVVPSILCGLLHIGYEPWFVASIAGSGVVLAIIRWKSGSLYVPLCLHAAGNLLVALDPYAWFAGTA